MINFYDGQITDILPCNFSHTPETQALSYALSKAVKRVLDYADKIKIYCNMKDQPHEILDILAVELRSQYYSEEMKLETKRNVIEDTLIWYQYAGTDYAVEKLIETIFGTGNVVNWYKYSGEPGHFKIETQNHGISKDALQKFNEVIEHVKRRSAILDAVEITLNAYLNYNCGIVVHTGDYITLIQEG